MNNQKGASFLSTLFVVVIFIFLAKILIAVWGPYFDDRMINREISEQLQTAPKDIPPSKFVTEMNQRLSRNGMVKLTFNDIAKVSTAENGLEVQKDYEVRKPFFLNIDLVLKYEKSFEQSSVQAK